MIVSLPWPDKRLSPNARQHWAAVAKVKKLAREEARLLTRGAIAKHGVATFEGEDRIPVRITFYPPDRRRRDSDDYKGPERRNRDE